MAGASWALQCTCGSTTSRACIPRWPHDLEFFFAKHKEVTEEIFTIKSLNYSRNKPIPLRISVTTSKNLISQCRVVLFEMCSKEIPLLCKGGEFAFPLVLNGLVGGSIP